MHSGLVRSAAYVDRWQCGARGWIDDYRGDASLSFHVCQLPGTHYGPHKCWCDTVFDVYQGHVVFDMFTRWRVVETNPDD